MLSVYLRQVLSSSMNVWNLFVNKIKSTSTRTEPWGHPYLFLLFGIYFLILSAVYFMYNTWLEPLKKHLSHFLLFSLNLMC